MGAVGLHHLGNGAAQQLPGGDLAHHFVDFLLFVLLFEPVGKGHDGMPGSAEYVGLVHGDDAVGDGHAQLRQTEAAELARTEVVEGFAGRGGQVKDADDGSGFRFGVAGKVHLRDFVQGGDVEDQVV